MAKTAPDLCLIRIPEKHNRELWTAMLRNDAVACRKLLERPFYNFNTGFLSTDQSFLMHGCIWGGSEIFKMIMARENVDINYRSARGVTALHCALGFARLEIVETLLGHPDLLIDQSDSLSEKTSLLAAACKSGNRLIVEMILKDPRISKLCAFQVQEGGGEIFDPFRDDEILATLLIEHADFGSQPQSLLQILAVASILNDRSADLRVFLRYPGIMFGDSGPREYYMHLACIANSPKCLVELIRDGRFGIQDSDMNGCNPMGHAVLCHSSECVSVILSSRVPLSGGIPFLVSMRRGPTEEENLAGICSCITGKLHEFSRDPLGYVAETRLRYRWYNEGVVVWIIIYLIDQGVLEINMDRFPSPEWLCFFEVVKGMGMEDQVELFSSIFPDFPIVFSGLDIKIALECIKEEFGIDAKGRERMSTECVPLPAPPPVYQPRQTRFRWVDSCIEWAVRVWRGVG